jgi:hypothetical protein
LLIGLALFYDAVEPHPWLLLLVAVPVLLLQILRFFPRQPTPPYEKFRESYDALLANDKQQLMERASDGLRTGALKKENYPLWGFWGTFGEHRQGVSTEPDVFRDALCCPDGKLRCTLVTLTAFSFKDQHMLVFEGAADITIGNVVFDSVREIAYSDIVGVSHHKTTKEFKLSELKEANRRELQECDLWSDIAKDAVNGIIAIDDNNFFEIALPDGERVRAVFRDVDLVPDEAYEYRYDKRSSACEIEDEEFRPGKVPSMRDMLRELTDNIGARKAEAAARRPGASA